MGFFPTVRYFFFPNAIERISSQQSYFSADVSIVFFLCFTITVPILTMPIINKNKGIKKQMAIPGANNVTTDNGPNN